MKKIIQTDKAPQAIGPYSQAIKTDHHLFTSGQLGITPATGNLVEGDIRDQTRQVLTNIQALIQSQGGTLKDVIKTTIFLADMEDYRIVNDIYGEFFNDYPPARSAIEVSRLPLDALIEMEAVAWIPD